MSTNDSSFSHEPITDAEKAKLQEEANERAFSTFERILKEAGLGEVDLRSADIKAVLAPKLDELYKTDKVLDYLALKSIGKRSIHIDIVSALLVEEDPEIIEMAKKEILTKEQNEKFEQLRRGR